jgi:hypothetical protein
MIHKQSCAEAILGFQRKHKILTPDADSVAIARELWLEWEKTGNAPPDINNIAKDYAKHENGFFYELVKLAEKIENAPLNIHYCQFTLDRYNAYACSAKDGYIILIDDVYFQILYFLCNIFVFDAMDIVREDEKEQVKTFVEEIIRVNYFNRQRVDFSRQGIHHVLLKRDYELAEFANYFFHALKAFIISHEIGHHVLKHTSGTVTKVFAVNNNSVTVEVDERKLANEFEADSYGYKLFDVLSNTNDDSVYYAWCKYKFSFAPVFLFRLFNSLDRIYEKVKNKPIVYAEHPHPVERIRSLEDKYSIETNDPLYLALNESLQYYLGETE